MMPSEAKTHFIVIRETENETTIARYEGVTRLSTWVTQEYVSPETIEELRTGEYDPDKE